MKELEKTQPGKPDQSVFNLGQWLGRREAFGLIAGRCSAAEVEILRKIKDEKIYLGSSSSWEEFCTARLHTVRRSADREISYLRRWGPAFFTVRQLTHITVREYAVIAGHISDEGVNLDGKLIPLQADQSEELTAAVEELLTRWEHEEPEVAEPAFGAVLKQCETIAAQMKLLKGELGVAQRLELGDAVARIRMTAAEIGVVIWDRR